MIGINAMQVMVFMSCVPIETSPKLTGALQESAAATGDPKPKILPSCGRVVAAIAEARALNLAEPPLGGMAMGTSTPLAGTAS